MPPLTAYDSADDLYAAMGAVRRANLAKLTPEADPKQSPAPEPTGAGTRRAVGGRLRWIALLSLAVLAAGSRLRRRPASSE